MASPPARLKGLVFGLLAALALAIRVSGLGQCPMHTDESVNAYILGGVLGGGVFHYDSHDRHGPALVAASLPIVWLEGSRRYDDLSERGVRLVPALAGACTVFLWVFAVEWLGWCSCMVAALIFAVAPLPVYYNRCYIHESLFVAFTFAAALAAFVALRRGSPFWAGASGACVALMIACKETAPLHWLAAMLAFGPALFQGEMKWRRWCLRPLAWAGISFLTAFLAVFWLLFTWGGRNPGVFHDLIQAVPHMTARAGGQGHAKGSFYYACLLAKDLSGIPILALALAGAVLCFIPSRPSPSIKASADHPIPDQSRAWRWCALYGFILFLFYSLIPYKTPWLALNFWLPISLMVGVLFQWIWARWPGRWHRSVALAGLLGLILALWHDTWERDFAGPADPSNPYAYAHTVDDLLGLAPRIETLQEQLHLKDPKIAVVAADPWPLPWYLRHFKKTGYWQPGADPGSADFYVTSPEAASSMTHLLAGYQAEFFGLRPDVLILLWEPEKTRGRND